MKKITDIANKNTIKRGIVTFIILILVLWAIDIVSTGKVQVVTRFGKVVRTNGEGIAVHIPIIERTKSIETTIRRESSQSVVATSNLQQVTVDTAVNYRITRENAIKNYQNFTKKNFVDIVIKPKIQDSIKTVTPKFTAEELVLRRTEVATEIKDQIATSLSDYGIEVVDVSIENYAFSPEYTIAVNQKSTIVQQIEANKLQTENIRIASDNSILQAQKAKEVRDIEAQQTETNLRYYQLRIQDMAVQKWNGVSPLYSGGDNLLTVPVK